MFFLLLDFERKLGWCERVNAALCFPNGLETAGAMLLERLLRFFKRFCTTRVMRIVLFFIIQRHFLLPWWMRRSFIQTASLENCCEKKCNKGKRKLHVLQTNANLQDSKVLPELISEDEMLWKRMGCILESDLTYLVPCRDSLLSWAELLPTPFTHLNQPKCWNQSQYFVGVFLEEI